MATSVSAAASAMMTVPDGTPCAPMALRTIWSTVAIFTNAVTVMNANGRSDTIASATTRTIGRESRSSDAAADPQLRGHVFCLPLSARARMSAKGAPRVGTPCGDVAGRDLAELGEPALADPDDEHLRPHPDE